MGLTSEFETSREIEGWKRIAEESRVRVKKSLKGQESFRIQKFQDLKFRIHRQIEND